MPEHRDYTASNIFITICIAIAIGSFSMVTQETANAIDYVHNAGLLESILAPLADNHKENYAYYYTNPEYFDSLDWESSPQQANSRRANDDGTLGETGLRWYYAHNDSGYGQKIAQLEIGQHITIDGIEYIIDNRGLSYAGAPTPDVQEMTGNADLILITCVEGAHTDTHPPEHVIWGHAVDPDSLPMEKRWN